MTFAYFLPWVKSGLRTVTKASGQAARDRVLNARRKKAEEAADMEKSFLNAQALARMQVVTAKRGSAITLNRGTTMTKRESGVVSLGKS